jgi:hypothetical protein
VGVAADLKTALPDINASLLVAAIRLDTKHPVIPTDGRSFRVVFGTISTAISLGRWRWVRSLTDRDTR